MNLYPKQTFRTEVVDLPITPLHYPLSYFINKLDKHLSLPGLIVGSMFPDLENPFIVLILGTQVPNRLVLHSIFGAVTIGAIFAVTLTVKIYPYLVTSLLHVNKERVKTKMQTLLRAIRFSSCRHSLPCSAGFHEPPI